MPSEELEMGRWIRAVVMGDATLMSMVSGAWSEVIPADATLPAVKYEFVSGTDLIVVGGVRIMTTSLYRIVVTGKGASPASIVAAVSRLDDLFKRAQGSTPTVQILSSVRREPSHFTEVQNQETYNHVGGLYQLQAQPVA
jgi:hypothetical protein